MNILVKSVNDEPRSLPVYETVGAAGFDFVADHDQLIMPGETAFIGTGLCFQIPYGFEIQVRARSGMTAKTKIRVGNSPGTIDSDFRGEVKIILDNNGTYPYKVTKGDRVAQGVFNKIEQANFQLVVELDSSERGENGFGSTGK